MQSFDDDPSIARRREREMRTVSQMIALYCRKNHVCSVREEAAYCGELLCAECLELDAYAVERTRRCRKMDVKTSCEACGNHCYRAAEREKVRAVMRFSGPRMLIHHPVAAIRHLIKK